MEVVIRETNGIEIRAFARSEVDYDGLMTCIDYAVGNINRGVFCPSELLVTVYYSDTAPAINFSPELLRKLAEARISLDIDLISCAE